MIHTARSRMIIITTFVVTILAAIVAIGLGSVHISVPDILSTLINGRDQEGVYTTIIWDIRLPRVLLALIIGASIAISGALLQAVMGNPLADPGLTGVTSGAAAFVLLILLANPELTHLIPLAAFVGGLIAAAIVYALAWRRTGITPITIILSGVAVNALCGGVIGFLSILYSDRLPSAVQWMNGSLAAKGNASLHMIYVYAIIGWILSIFAIRKANIIRLGDQVATNLGESVTRIRIMLSILAVFLAAISVAAVGMIGFVGLIVPHMARLLVGSDYKYMLPMSMAMGAIVLLIADTGGRTLFAPLDIPAGILMAVLGGPYFLYLMRKRAF
ncbi:MULTISPECIES: FecCD family ABC transporter permease [Lysinibacillus]|jgi:iron complex transport system permease protein|uniref:Iron ABC transporter permease n=1 Tax=Lysinibacillus fusiformis TaxID=28031 RepID=A0A2I0V4K3_9BACI|nr:MULTISPECIES: iron ABC transporter permease [Lysinibacillus]KUF35147.1 iron ABC transporter permease [Lysinibacillus sp. F5]MEE3807069.1 iron ABC transporter permease [Lysinibacillus fusiformis]PKU53223.1 iron ABC transporter permease [Lysinibacillus fusiformis]WCH48819.1 iron ABC transporter permease [Lysinibacillus sp. OF-1]SCX85818.1 iron complex transport system permease protein [Lysinibacillus sp. SG9]